MGLNVQNEYAIGDKTEWTYQILATARFVRKKITIKIHKDK